MPKTVLPGYEQLFKRTACYEFIDDDRRRIERLSLKSKSKDKIVSAIEENSHLFGKLLEKKELGDVTVWKYKTDILVSVDGLEEEGWTTLAMTKNGNGHDLKVYTKAVPGNGGLASVNLKPLRELQYT